MLSKLSNVMNLLSSLGSSNISKGDGTYTSSGDAFHDWMNRIGRLPRLFLLFGVVGLMMWPMFDPTAFMGWTKAIGTIPENLWVLILLIVGSWATTKFIRDVKYKSFSHTSFTEVTSGNKNQEFEQEPDEDLVTPSVPTENSAISAWKTNAS